MRRNDEVQSAIVAYLKSKATIVVELLANGATEIREDQWQGTEFAYPCIRVRMISNNPENSNCKFSDVSFGIQVMSEEASTKQADRISGIINQVLHQRSFVSEGMQFNLSTSNLVPAYRKDTRTWQSEVLLSGTISS